MIPISVCIIAKNEEKRIEKCLKSIHKHPFEIIVVDTGSTDKTKEIASKYANQVLSFPWINSFSAARNYSINHASNDWVLILDCDEIVEKIDFQGMQKLMEKYPSSLGQLTRDNLIYDEKNKATHSFDKVERLFDRRIFEYEGSIHEQLVRKTPGQLTAFEFPMLISHTGFSGTAHDMEAKAQRNISMLLAELHRDPDDPYIYYQLGESYMLKGEFEQAYQYFDQGFYKNVDEKLEYVQRMIISYGYSMLNTNRIEKALTLANVYDAFNNNADFLFLMGNIYLRARQNDKALLEFLKATTMKRHFDEGTNSFRAFHNIGCIYEAYGQYDEARKYFLKAGNFDLSIERLKNLPSSDESQG